MLFKRWLCDLERGPHKFGDWEEVGVVNEYAQYHIGFEAIPEGGVKRLYTEPRVVGTVLVQKRVCARCHFTQLHRAKY